MHVAIIMDGNRRYALKKGKDTLHGHKKGAEKLLEVLRWCKEQEVKELTVYSFSVQNFNRSEAEKSYLFKAFEDNFEKAKNDKRYMEEGIKIKVIGRIWMFPENLQKKIKEIMDLTKNNDKFKLNIALGYGGREEIVDACKKITAKVKDNEIKIDDITTETISDNIYLNSEPDIVIRPGKEKRTSNFLMWQSYYSEWFFSDKMWPEFDKTEFINILNKYKERKRRFGK